MKFPVALVTAVMLAIIAVPSLAVEVPFNQAQFDSIIAAGKPAAVVFHADWCPTCRAQAPLLKELTQTPELEGLPPIGSQPLPPGSKFEAYHTNRDLPAARGRDAAATVTKSSSPTNY